MTSKYQLTFKQFCCSRSGCKLIYQLLPAQASRENKSTVPRSMGHAYIATCMVHLYGEFVNKIYQTPSVVIFYHHHHHHHNKNNNNHNNNKNGPRVQCARLIHIGIFEGLSYHLFGGHPHGDLIVEDRPFGSLTTRVHAGGAGNRRFFASFHRFFCEKWLLK